MSKQAFEIRNNILNNMQNTLVKNQGSYNFDIASAVAFEIENNYVDLEDLKLQMFPQTVTREPYLTYHLETYGLERLGATFATGEITITGKVATQIKANTVVISRLGIKYKTLKNVILDSYGKAKVSIQSLVAGIGGNCAIGDITSFEIAVTNIYSVTNEVAVSGGAEIETVESCRARMKYKASVPSHSGNKNEYTQWVKSIGGIGNVKVFGASEYDVLAGNVHIYFSTLDGQVPSVELINQVKAYLEDNRTPVGAKISVLGFLPLATNITFDSVTVKKGSWTKETWINKFKELVQLGYATDNFIVNNVVPYPKVSAIALDLDGTVIYDNMKMNNSISNLNIAYNQTPVIGTVTITTFNEVE